MQRKICFLVHFYITAREMSKIYKMQENLPDVYCIKMHYFKKDKPKFKS